MQADIFILYDRIAQYHDSIHQYFHKKVCSGWCGYFNFVALNVDLTFIHPFKNHKNTSFLFFT